MTYSNNTDNTGSYPTSSAFGEPDAYPFLSQMSATEEVTNTYTYGAFTDLWGMAEQPGPTVNSSTSLSAASYESVASATSYETQANGYGQPSYTEQYWPAVGQQAQSYYSGFSGYDSYFASTVAPETSTAIPTPSSVPFDYWGIDQSGPSTSTSYVEDVHGSYQPGTGPTRTGLTQTSRFQPYERSRARTNEHRNAEAGPSTLVPPPVPYVGSPTPRPSGGISETTADAEQEQTFTEEEEAPKPKRTRLPHGQGRPRPTRVKMSGEVSRLCEWLEWWCELNVALSVNQALAIAVKIIPIIRSPEYAEPCLRTGEGKRTASSKSARDEFERRNEERRLYQELSRYYQLGPGQVVWARRPLLLKVLADLEDIAPLPEPSDG